MKEYEKPTAEMITYEVSERIAADTSGWDAGYPTNP